MDSDGVVVMSAWMLCVRVERRKWEKERREREREREREMSTVHSPKFFGYTSEIVGSGLMSTVSTPNFFCYTSETTGSDFCMFSSICLNKIW
jgi:hypothetical protein